MSKLEELINELCPNGVEYKALEDILKIKNGSDYKQYGEGNIPVYGSGGIMTYIDHYAYNKPSVLIPRKGSVDKLYYVDTPFWNVDTIFYTDINTQLANPKYVYHCLLKEHLEQYNSAGGVPSLTQKVLNKITIPLPPLKIQYEIIRILSNLTKVTYKLCEKLNLDLDLMKKQKDYYMDLLVSSSPQYESRPLRDLIKVRMCKRIKKEQTNQDYGIPFYKNGTLGKQADSFIPIELYEEYKAKYPFPQKGTVMLSTAGTIGRTYIYDGQPAYFQDSNVVWLENDESIVTNEYLYWYCVSFPWKLPSRGTIKHLHNDMILDTIISIPPLEEQHNRAALLHSVIEDFDELHNCIQREIEARRKQYEYYRDKLLTFKRLPEQEM